MILGEELKKYLEIETNSVEEFKEKLLELFVDDEEYIECMCEELK